MHITNGSDQGWGSGGAMKQPLNIYFRTRTLTVSSATEAAGPSTAVSFPLNCQRVSLL